jgi:hypothetical protein
MIKEFTDKWIKNKNRLQKWFESIVPNRNVFEEYEFTYEDIIRGIIIHVLNNHIDTEEPSNDIKDFSTDIKVIDDGDYQGTQIFIIHRNGYQPDVSDYFYTHNYYGSCSGCDTLLGIMAIEDKKVQVKELMILSLHLIQKFEQFK